MMDKVYLYFSPESHISDVRAVMDSYGIRLMIGDKVYLQAPLHFCSHYNEKPVEHLTHDSQLFPKIDGRIKISMIQYTPPEDDDVLEGIRERNTRWPFFVKHTLTIMFAFGDQWQEYKFTPGKTYEEREHTE